MQKTENPNLSNTESAKDGQIDKAAIVGEPITSKRVGRPDNRVGRPDNRELDNTTRVGRPDNR
jgi:hypothetical protein